MNTLPLADLVAAFRACSLPRQEWTHVAHLRVGAWHVHHHGAAAALPMLRSGIRKLNDQHGTLNSPSSGYHETITAAYVHLIEAFLLAFDPEVALEHRVDALIESPLAERSVLLRFWSRDLLMSARARAEWVPPDRVPLAGDPGAACNRLQAKFCIPLDAGLEQAVALAVTRRPGKGDSR